MSDAIPPALARPIAHLEHCLCILEQAAMPSQDLEALQTFLTHAKGYLSKDLSPDTEALENWETDIISLGSDGLQLYYNQSGNSWSTKHTLKQFPPVDDLSSVLTLDLLGNGTACLVWSSPLPGNASRAMRYIDLMGGQKPHLTVKTTNNLGTETTLKYLPATEFYLRDKLAGNPGLPAFRFRCTMWNT
jgi:hypothetical protein